MITTRMRYLVLLTLAVLLATPGWAHAQTTKDRAVEQYLCKDVMRESGPDRDVAIAFLHGFLLGKSGTSKFNVDILHRQTGEFIELCLDKSSEKAIDIMSTLKKDGR